MIVKGFIKQLSKLMLTLFISSVMFMIYYTYSGNSNLIGTILHYGSRRIITSKMNIAILMPTTTRNITSPKLDELSLMTFCLPSIVNTMESVY